MDDGGGSEAGLRGVMGVDWYGTGPVFLAATVAQYVRRKLQTRRVTGFLCTTPAPVWRFRHCCYACAPIRSCTLQDGRVAQIEYEPSAERGKKLSNTIRKIAINTGGGDAPGLNAVIHGAVYAARGLGWEILGIREGYDGILEPERYPDCGLPEPKRRLRSLPKQCATFGWMGRISWLWSGELRWTISG